MLHLLRDENFVAPTHNSQLMSCWIQSVSVRCSNYSSTGSFGRVWGALRATSIPSVSRVVFWRTCWGDTVLRVHWFTRPRESCTCSGQWQVGNRERGGGRIPLLTPLNDHRLILHRGSLYTVPPSGKVSPANKPVEGYAVGDRRGAGVLCNAQLPTQSGDWSRGRSG